MGQDKGGLGCNRAGVRARCHCPKGEWEISAFVGNQPLGEKLILWEHQWPWYLRGNNRLHLEYQRHNNSHLQIVFWVGLDSNIIEELGRWRPRRLKIPRLVKLCMVASFDNAHVEIEIDNALVCSSVAKENAFKVVVVEFAAPTSRHLNTDPRTKELEMGKVRADPVVGFEWGPLCGGVNEAVVQVHQV